ncbi:hypothetical protein P9112_008181 [Eukaryota sp. TZLM1-RC]
MSGQGKIIILEGNISAGKSTLASALGSYLDAKVFFEPTVTNPYLAKFYANPKRYALKMQVYLLRQRFIIYISALRHLIKTGQSVILDRSIFSDEVFALTNVHVGNISKEQYQYYKSLRSQMIDILPIPHLTIFLQTSPSVCQERVMKRARACESGIPLSYLQKLHENYQVFYKKMQEAGSCVFSFDWNNFGDSSDVCSVANVPILPSPLPLSASLLFSDMYIMSRLRIDNEVESSDEEDCEEEFSLHQDVLKIQFGLESVAV